MAKLKSGLTGAREAGRLLQALPNAAEHRVLQAAVMAGARAWAKGIKTAAPVGNGKKSPSSKQYGTLKKNIRAQSLRAARRKGKRGARVYTRHAFWAYFLEFGTRFISAQPWFRPAAEQHRQAALNAQSKAVGRGIEREADKLAKRYRVK